jgi:hypothetical protein
MECRQPTWNDEVPSAPACGPGEGALSSLTPEGAQILRVRTGPDRTVIVRTGLTYVPSATGIRFPGVLRLKTRAETRGIGRLDLCICSVVVGNGSTGRCPRGYTRNIERFVLRIGYPVWGRSRTCAKRSSTVSLSARYSGESKSPVRTRSCAMRRATCRI